MKGFIEVHYESKSVLLNVNYISAVTSHGTKSVIVNTNGEALEVDECYGKVVQLMQEAV